MTLIIMMRSYCLGRLLFTLSFEILEDKNKVVNQWIIISIFFFFNISIEEDFENHLLHV